MLLFPQSERSTLILHFSLKNARQSPQKITKLLDNANHREAFFINSKHFNFFSEAVIHRGRRPRWITPSSICLILHILLRLIH